MKILNESELLETLRLGQSEGTGLCVLGTHRQFAFGAGKIHEATDQRVRIALTSVVKRLEVAPEDPVNDVSFDPKDVVAAWQSSTHELKDPGLVGEHWDDSLALTLRGHVVSVTLYRASAFKQRGNGAP